MCLPGLPEAGPPRSPRCRPPPTALAQQIWRGIHEGAHLDHLSVAGRGGPAGAQPGGVRHRAADGRVVRDGGRDPRRGLCILAEEGHAVWQLGAGLIEQAARLPGGSDPAPEFTDLPTLAEVYVRGPASRSWPAARRPGLSQNSSSARCGPAGAPRARPIRPPPAFGSAAAEMIIRHRSIRSLTVSVGKLYWHKFCVDGHGLSSYTKLILVLTGSRTGNVADEL